MHFYNYKRLPVCFNPSLTLPLVVHTGFMIKVNASQQADNHQHCQFHSRDAGDGRFTRTLTRITLLLIEIKVTTMRMTVVMVYRKL